MTSIIDPTPRSPEYEKNTNEQYASLGRFIEAFEAMVEKVRNNCIEILARGLQHEDLVTIALHHGALTAKPLFDIWRALNAESFIQKKTPIRDRDDYNAIIKQVAAEYEGLTTLRNNMLHGTWFVGYVGSEDPDAAEFYIRKAIASKDGLGFLTLPKTAAELQKHSNRCGEAAGWISLIHLCVTLNNETFNIRNKLYRNGKPMVLNPDDE